ncbi:LysR family transcriptional regulator [Shewanella sp. UCD-KL12]|uniref:LysR family transcriptional regulator n=1 Tax=Shewanella sp. UCD-KL12 TaxID=1917163 RepID=UPI0009709AA7|nr:LysR family transcriptional regulator [Shewanella sp. UCD-KL12]
MDNLDFKALKVLLNLYNTRNTYVTAEQLDISQSAVARNLAKCRQSFNEPLFIRTGNQLSPTSFTEALVEKLPSLLNSIDDIVATNSEFNPSQLTGRYVIYLNHQSQLIYGNKIFELLNRDAPKATWCIKGWDQSSVEQLLDNRAAIGVNYYSATLPNSIYQEKIVDDVFAIFAHKDHPLHQLEQVTHKALEQYHFVSIVIPNIDEKNIYVDSVLEEMGVKASVGCQTDSLNLGMQVAESQNMLLLSTIDIALYPSTNLRPIKFKVNSKRLPDSHIVCTYARKNRNKPLTKWLKKILDETATHFPPFEF